MPRGSRPRADGRGRTPPSHCHRHRHRHGRWPGRTATAQGPWYTAHGPRPKADGRRPIAHRPWRIAHGASPIAHGPWPGRLDGERARARAELGVGISCRPAFRCKMERWWAFPWHDRPSPAVWSRLVPVHGSRFTARGSRFTAPVASSSLSHPRPATSTHRADTSSPPPLLASFGQTPCLTTASSAISHGP